MTREGDTTMTRVFTAEETWPRVLYSDPREGLELRLTQPPNNYIEVVRVGGGKVFSMPCVETELKDIVVLMLFRAYGEQKRQAARQARVIEGLKVWALDNQFACRCPDICQCGTLLDYDNFLIELDRLMAEEETR